MASDLYDDFRGKPELQQIQNQQSPWISQQGYLKNLFSRADDIYGQNRSQSPFMTQAQNMVVQRANNPNSLTGQSEQVLGDTLSGKYLNPNTNPFFSSAVNDSLGLAKSQVLGLYGGAAGQNIGNSGFQEHLARTLGQLATNAYADQYGQERQNQLNATNMAPELDYARANALFNVGQQQQSFPWDQLARYQAAVTGNYGGVSDIQSPWTSQIFNRGARERQNVSQDIGSMSRMFSDVRLKENVERVGTHDSGIGIYKYNYKGSDVPQIGVLAQEVEQVKPEAVEEVAGFKTVNFKMI
jgi:hypothetical protein